MTRAKLFRDVPFARTGPQTYRADEIGAEGIGTVSVNRPRAEVERSAGSFEGVPVVIEHPSSLMDANAVDRRAVGLASGVRFDGVTEQLRADLILWDADAIRTVANGTRELSAGYEAQYEPEGNGYAQRAIKGNHIALVKAGRSGAAQRIGG